MDRDTAMSSVLRHLKSPAPNYYEVLGVNSWDDITTVRKAYHRLAVLLHPDKNHHPAAGQCFELISKAWNALAPEKTEVSVSVPKKTSVWDSFVSTSSSTSAASSFMSSDPSSSSFSGCSFRSVASASRPPPDISTLRSKPQQHSFSTSATAASMDANTTDVLDSFSEFEDFELNFAPIKAHQVQLDFTKNGVNHHKNNVPKKNEKKLSKASPKGVKTKENARNKKLKDTSPLKEKEKISKSNSSGSGSRNARSRISRSSRNGDSNDSDCDGSCSASNSSGSSTGSGSNSDGKRTADSSQAHHSDGQSSQGAGEDLIPHEDDMPELEPDLNLTVVEDGWASDRSYSPSHWDRDRDFTTSPYSPLPNSSPATSSCDASASSSSSASTKSFSTSAQTLFPPSCSSSSANTSDRSTSPSKTNQYASSCLQRPSSPSQFLTPPSPTSHYSQQPFSSSSSSSLEVLSPPSFSSIAKRKPSLITTSSDNGKTNSPLPSMPEITPPTCSTGPSFANTLSFRMCSSSARAPFSSSSSASSSTSLCRGGRVLTSCAPSITSQLACFSSGAQAKEPICIDDDEDVEEALFNHGDKFSEASVRKPDVQVLDEDGEEGDEEGDEGDEEAEEHTDLQKEASELPVSFPSVTPSLSFSSLRRGSLQSRSVKVAQPMPTPSNKPRKKAAKEGSSLSPSEKPISRWQRCGRGGIIRWSAPKRKKSKNDATKTSAKRSKTSSNTEKDKPANVDLPRDDLTTAQVSTNSGISGVAVKPPSSLSVVKSKSAGKPASQDIRAMFSGPKLRT